MKLIFLDIDGTMIPYGSGQSYRKDEKFNKQHMNALNAIVDATNANIVLSSCWSKHFNTTEDVANWLKFCGLSRSDLVFGKIRHWGNRTESIQLYIEKLEYEEWFIEGLLILDDESISEPLDKHSIKVQPNIGLNISHYDEAIRILNSIKFTDIY